MRDLGESFFRFAADALGGRVRGDEAGIFFLDALKLAYEVVVLGVGDGGLVEDVVEMLVVTDLVAEGVEFIEFRNANSWNIVFRANNPWDKIADKAGARCETWKTEKQPFSLVEPVG